MKNRKENLNADQGSGMLIDYNVSEIPCSILEPKNGWTIFQVLLRHITAV